MRPGHRHVGFGEAGQIFKTRHPLIESAKDVRVVRQCSSESSRSEGGVFQNPERHEAILIPYAWKRTKQRAVDKREGHDRRRQAQAETPDHRE